MADRNCTQCQTRWQARGKILERVHRDVDAAAEQRILDFLGEKPLPLELVERPVHFRVAARLDDHDLRPHPLCGEAIPHPLRLPPRQLAAARTELHANRLARDSTRPGTVCGSASMISRKPSSRAVSAVTGPIVAVTNRPDVAAGRPTRSTKLRTVDDDVNVTASMRPRLMSFASPLRSSWTGKVRYTAMLSTVAPCAVRLAARTSRGSSAVGMSTRAPVSVPLRWMRASASASATNSLGTRAGTTPRRVSASAVAVPMAATDVGANTRGVSPHAMRRSNTICTAFWLVKTTQR